MTGLKLFQEACKKYSSNATWESLTPWDRGQWDRHAEKLTMEIRLARELLEAHGYTVVADLGAAVNRFLCWKLPPTFGPDCGISFKPVPHGDGFIWPVGTNLLTADEATGMLKHILAVPEN